MKRFASALALCVALWIGAPACSVGMSPTLPTLVTQRHERDCLIAGIAMLIERRYEDVDLARRVLDIEFTALGLPVVDGLRIMRSLGSPGAYVRFDPNAFAKVNDPPHGILVVGYPGQDTAHAVFTTRHFIFDPALPHPEPWVLWFRDQPLLRILGIVVRTAE